MRQLFLEKGALAIKEVCEPSLDDYSVLISVSYSYMSVGAGLASMLDADQHLFFKNIPTKVKKIVELASHKGIDYTASYIKNKMNERIAAFGHSCSGTVLGVGQKVKNFRVGDLVACAGPGLANHADVVCVPENLVVRIKNEELLKSASLVGLGAMALQSIRRASLELGESVAIIGLDSFGQLAMRLASLNGAQVIGIDSSLDRLEYCQNIGFNAVYSFEKDNIEQSINTLTEAKGLDCIIISPESICEDIVNKALKLIRKKGRIVIAGNQQVSLSHQDPYQKEVDILFSLSYGPGRHDPNYEYKGLDYPYSYIRWTENRNMEFFVKLIESRRLQIDDMVNNEVSVETVTSSLQEMRAKNWIGVVVNFMRDKKIKQREDNGVKVIPAHVSTIKDDIIVSIVGFGNFSKNVLLPVLKNMRNVEIDTVLDEDVTSVMRARKSLKKSTVCVGNFLSILRSKAHVIFVSPSVEITVDEMIQCFDAGKALFIAHPLTFSSSDLDVLERYMEKNKTANLCVGLYRPFSPLIQKIKEEVKKRSSPLVINYRLNLGDLHDYEKIHAQWRAGKTVIEGSHIFDLFMHLTEAKPISISIDSLRASSQSQLYPTDNFIVQLAFNDGSICSLTVTCLGNAEAGHERMEVFYDAKTVIMEDFFYVRGFGVDLVLNERLKISNNGYQELLLKFFASLRSGKNTSIIPCKRIIDVARLALAADSMIISGGNIGFEMSHEKKTQEL